MNAILINPITKTITSVEHTGGLKSIYNLLDCRTVDVARFDNLHGDVIYIDDEGLYVNDCFFLVDGFPTPLAGLGLLVGINWEGDDITPTTTLDEIKRKVKFLTKAQAVGVFQQLQEEKV